MALLVVLVFVLPLLIGVGIVAVKVLEIVFNRDLARSSDVARTLVAVVGLAIATAAGWLATVIANGGDRTHLNWAAEIPLLVILACSEWVWIQAVCRPRPRPIIPIICAVASLTFLIQFAAQIMDAA